VPDALGTGVGEAVALDAEPLAAPLGVPEAVAPSVGDALGATVALGDASVGVALGTAGSVGTGGETLGGRLPDGLGEGLEGPTGSVGEGVGVADGSGLGVGVADGSGLGVGSADGDAGGASGSGEEESPIPTPDTAPEVSCDSPVPWAPPWPPELSASCGLLAPSARGPMESWNTVPVPPAGAAGPCT